MENNSWRFGLIFRGLDIGLACACAHVHTPHLDSEVKDMLPSHISMDKEWVDKIEVRRLVVRG